MAKRLKMFWPAVVVTCFAVSPGCAQYSRDDSSVAPMGKANAGPFAPGGGTMTGGRSSVVDAKPGSIAHEPDGDQQPSTKSSIER